MNNCTCILQMIYYDKIDISEGININKTSKLKQRYLSLLIFFDNSLKFEPYICNGCHYLFMNIIKHKNLLSHIKMGKEILTFGDIEIEKNKFYCHKSPIFL